jgi:pimeloyl-ACP methyl ester carboxylesterase
MAPVRGMVGRQDRIAPPEHARGLLADLPNRVSVTEPEGVGHGLLPERPVSAAVLGDLRVWTDRSA